MAIAITPVDLPHGKHAYDLATRFLGSIWFLMLAALVAWGTIGDVGKTPWLQVLSRACLAAFYLVLWFLIITRPPAKSEASGLLPRVAAFVGTYIPWAITFTARSETATPNLLSMLCVVCGAILMLVSIWHLGRAFSIVPQARSVVQSGPYRWVRHPLYLAEEIALFGVVLQFLSPLTVMILVGHVAVQVYRIHYEEELLRQTFPEYGGVRWRLIPFVW